MRELEGIGWLGGLDKFLGECDAEDPNKEQPAPEGAGFAVEPVSSLLCQGVNQSGLVRTAPTGR
jgi:hypothetical protein